MEKCSQGNDFPTIIFFLNLFWRNNGNVDFKNDFRIISSEKCFPINIFYIKSFVKMFSGKCSQGKDFATLLNFQPNIIEEIMENFDSKYNFSILYEARKIFP